MGLLDFAHHEHIDSWYHHTASGPTFAPLHDALDADVCVVGGGYTGLSAALELAERGLNVVLLEGARLGWAASGRNGGQVLTDIACGMDSVRAQLGADAARAIWDMSVEAVHLVGERCARYQIDADLRWGYFHAALKPRQMHELARWQASAAQDYGYSAYRLVEQEEVASLVASPRYIGGLYDPGCGQLHPLKYALGLAAAAVNAGVRVYEHSPALRIHPGTPSVVHSEHGQVRARHVVLACNSHIGQLAPSLAAKIMPVGTYMIATAPLGQARAQALIPGQVAVCDSNFVLDYFRLSADHRLLFGGKVSYSGLPPANLQAAMRRDMLRVFPQLADVAIDSGWGGFVDITQSRAPHFGQLPGNLWFAQGFSGHGVALTGLAGKLIAEAICGTPQRFALFSRFRHASFPGGRWLRTPALVLAMLYYRMRDWL